MKKTTMHNSKASREVRDIAEEMSEEELRKASRGYIGETEKNVSYRRRS